MACTVGWGVTSIEKLSGWPYLASYCFSSCLAFVEVVGLHAGVGRVVGLVGPERALRRFEHPLNATLDRLARSVA